ncbi:hypothetical protein [Pedobacter aquatilis]|uniref:hypothetical protein n=1 Tax=Pedobacter aquatilis TaxID=351343 RepID=UPI002930662B|nr:hypothetical protein [Pedobacter aquatilis]
MYNLNDIEAETNAAQKKFDEAFVKQYFSENGEAIYIFKDGSDLKELVKATERILKDKGDFPYTTNVKVTHADLKEFETFVMFGEALDLSEFESEQDKLDSNAIDAFEEFMKFPDTPSKFDANRNLVYELPQDVTLSYVSEEIDKYIQREVAKNKSFSVTLVCGKDKVVLEYSEEV